MDMTNWQNSDINVDSLWIINERDKSGKHSNVYHGNFIPQIPNQLIRRFTNSGETVLEMFTGSGTTLYECENLKRNYVGFDINQEIIDYVNSKMTDCTEIKFCVNNCDVVNTEKFKVCAAESLASVNEKEKKAHFLIAHPPYLDIIKFTDLKEDLSQISEVQPFVDKMIQALANALEYLYRGRYFAVVIGDVYKKSEVVPLSFYLMDAIKKNFKVKMKGVIVKNIEGNRGKLGVGGIWKYRAMKSDYYLFKHEYIFVFKKDF